MKERIWNAFIAFSFIFSLTAFVIYKHYIKKSSYSETE